MALIEVDFPGGLAVDAKIGNFTIHTDQPVSYGGGGSAPSPFEVFLSSIAACAGYFAVAFCRERDISTEGMKLYTDIEKNPETKTLSKVTIRLVLPPGFPEKYKKAIIRTMDQCSVKRAIAAQPEFVVDAE